MSLKEKLDATRAAYAARVPADKQEIMTRATTDLRASGILQRSWPSESQRLSFRRRTTMAE